MCRTGRGFPFEGSAVSHRGGGSDRWTPRGVATGAVGGLGGGTEELPVGTAFIGVAETAPWESGDSGASVSQYEFDGD